MRSQRASYKRERLPQRPHNNNPCKALPSRRQLGTTLEGLESHLPISKPKPKMPRGQQAERCSHEHRSCEVWVVVVVGITCRDGDTAIFPRHCCYAAARAGCGRRGGGGGGGHDVLARERQKRTVIKGKRRTSRIKTHRRPVGWQTVFILHVPDTKRPTADRLGKRTRNTRPIPLCWETLQQNPPRES
jgi:hypothetical protein